MGGGWDPWAAQKKKLHEERESRMLALRAESKAQMEARMARQAARGRVVAGAMAGAVAGAGHGRRPGAGEVARDAGAVDATSPRLVATATRSVVAAPAPVGAARLGKRANARAAHHGEAEQRKAEVRVLWQDVCPQLLCHTR